VIFLHGYSSIFVLCRRSDVMQERFAGTPVSKANS